MNYEITPRSRAKDFSRQIHSIIDNFVFWISDNVPHRFLPDPVLILLNDYLEKRVRELQHETIRQAWDIAYLEKELEKLKQEKEKAPSEE